jgi:hypothetical protein
VNIKTNLATGMLFSVISIILILLVPSQISVPKFSSGGPSPRAIPYMVLIGILICSICLIIQSAVFKKEEPTFFNIKTEKAAIIIMGIMTLFTIIMIKLGFLIAVVVVLPMMLFVYGERKPSVYIITLLGGIAVYYLFLNVFNISLPRFGG